MPRISSFFGIVIEMYFGDHPPAHFHTRHGDEAAKIAIATGTVIRGSLSPRAHRLVREWLEEHRDELEANFERVVETPTPSADRAAEMTEMIHATAVEPLTGLRIRVTFSDGAVKDIDLGELMAGGGVFAPIRERREIFEAVRINPESRTVEWPGEVDLDPEVLYGLFEPASGVRIPRHTLREPAEVG